MILIGFNGKSGVGTTTAAHFTKLNVIELESELKQDLIKIFKLSSDSFVSDKIDKCIDINEESRNLYPDVSDDLWYELFPKLTPRFILHTYSSKLRTRDPLHFVRNISFDKDLAITDIKTNEEAEYLKRNGVYIVEIIRASVYNGPNITYTLQSDLIRKKIIINDNDRNKLDSMQQKIEQIIQGLGMI